MAGRAAADSSGGAGPLRSQLTRVDASKATPPPRFELKPPKGAGSPNVVFVLIDNMGFADPSCFGGAVDMSAFDRLAQGGLRYTNFHTAPVCSPTRVALLTGRNSHSANMGEVAEMGTAFPGMTCVRPSSIAPLAEVLRLNGYGTGSSGLPRQHRHHRPGDQVGPRPAVAHAGQPFFIYYAAAGTHDPHHVPKKWIAKYKGKFDQGWEKLREEILARQIALGIVPPSTALAPMPEVVEPWSSYKPEEQRVLAREMEVYAGMAEHTDFEIGRLIQAIEDLGELDNTLVVWIAGDNGGSPFGGPIGARSTSWPRSTACPRRWRTCWRTSTTSAGRTPPTTTRWAGAKRAARRWSAGRGTRTFAATRNATVIHWPKGIEAKGEIRTQFQHIIDLAPTVLEAARAARAEGRERDDADAPRRPKPAPHVQRRRGHLPAHDAVLRVRRQPRHVPGRWYATTLHKAFWEPAPRATFEQDTWELYDTEADFSLANDLAATTAS